MRASVRPWVKSNRKAAKDEEEEEKVVSRTGGCLAMNTGSLMADSMDTTVPSIIQDDNQVDVLSVAQLDTYTSQRTRPVKPKAKNAEYDKASNWQAQAEWYEATWENEEYVASKGKQGKGKKSKSKGKSKGKSTPRPTQSQTPRTDRPQPRSKAEARSRVADGFLLAMMTTKSKPTWRHATWNSADYTVCTAVKPQKKFSVLKPGKWSSAPRSRIALYGHDAKSMQNFT